MIKNQESPQKINNKALENKVRLLLGFTGSVASIKYNELITSLINQIKRPLEIRIVHTQRALTFIDSKTLPQEIQIFSDEMEWSSWQQKGDPVLHIELRKWADIFLIAPLSANTMAKLVNGLCDNLLTCVFRAWDFSQQNTLLELDEINQPVALLTKPIIVAPAMNTLMYQNTITEKQIKKLAKMNVVVISPVEKKLACGDQGVGAMQSPEKISQIVNQIIEKNLNYI